MLEEVIYQNYGITVEQQQPASRFLSFTSGTMIYHIIPLETVNGEELAERHHMSEHLRNVGDDGVSTFVLANHGSYVSEVDEKAFLLLVNEEHQPPIGQKIGSELAVFHARGRTIQQKITKCSRIGQWKKLWEGRIDQLEKVWGETLQAHPANEFEQLFVETFPYYMAVGENALQYLVDTEIDGVPEAVDSGTVCYERFHQNTWEGEGRMKNPFDWVFDHASRDVAEWVRKYYFQQIHTHQSGVREFFLDYQRVEQIPSFFARLLYARLLFPIHYFEKVEEYFSTKKISRVHELEEEMTTIVKMSQHYELFLKHFFELAEIPAKQLEIPELGWL